MLHDPQFWFAAICAVASLIFIFGEIAKLIRSLWH
jgi:hypothetical protein